MKKILILALTLVLALALVACSGGIKDGTYTAQLAEASHGWTDTLSVTYKDGKVAEASYDAFDADGKLKSAATQEEYDMTPHPTEWIPTLNANIVAAGSSDKIEAVAGATTSSEIAKLLMAAVEEKAKAGDTNTAMVAPPAK
ncbi:MAG: hypothetical protein RSA17_02410 [Ruthenibacterium sp.]